MTSKVCKSCQSEKTLDCFSKGNGKFRKLNVCKECDSARRREYHANLTDEQRQQKATIQKIRDYKVKYGLTEEQAVELANDRHGCCAICNEHKPLVVDHCHNSGSFRGLLCQTCNSLLGYAKDNIDILQNAIKYLYKEAA